MGICPATTRCVREHSLRTIPACPEIADSRAYRLTRRSRRDSIRGTGPNTDQTSGPHRWWNTCTGLTLNMEMPMSQADSAYTTSRSIFAGGRALRRRQFVTGAAATLAGAITASRAERVLAPCATDPILDAIEGHRRAFEELGRLLGEQDAAERELRRAPKGRRAELQARLARLCEAEGALGSTETKASLRLAGTVPTSLSGAAAALHYVRERYEVGHYPMYEEDGYRLLLFSAERTICAAAGLAVA
jgi:hypothetical protein